jgi:hypothetical protein
MAQAFCAIPLKPARGFYVLKRYTVAETGNAVIAQAAARFTIFEGWELVPPKVKERNPQLVCEKVVTSDLARNP